jgi:hypothetical protein
MDEWLPWVEGRGVGYIGNTEGDGNILYGGYSIHVLKPTALYTTKSKLY